MATVALGGGILIDGGQVTISNASITGNHASGASGANGASGGIGLAGAPGTAGGNARGGGIYLAGGQLSVIDSQIALELRPWRQGGRWRRWG